MSAKATRNIKQILAELAALYESRDLQNAQLERKLAPHRKTLATAEAAYKDNTREILEKFERGNAETQARINALEKQAEAEMLSTADPTLGVLSVACVRRAGLVAEATTNARREVNAQKFFDQTPAEKRDAKFWECVSIAVTKAEKFLGDAVNSISRVKRYHNVSIKAEKQ